MCPRLSTIPARAVGDPNLQNAALRVLNALGMYTNNDGWCFPSQTTLASILRISQQAVGKQIKILAQLKYIQIFYRLNDQGRRINCVYRILHDHIQPEVIAGLPNGIRSEELQLSTNFVISEVVTLQPQKLLGDPNLTTSEVVTPQPQKLWGKSEPTTSEVVGLKGTYNLRSCEPTTPEVVPPTTSGVVLTTQLTTQLTIPRVKKEEEVLMLTPAQENFDPASSSPSFLEIDCEAWLDDGEPSVEMPEYPAEIPDDPTPTREDAWQVNLPQVYYPETVSQAQKHPDLRIYTLLTNVFPGDANYVTIIDTIQFLRQKYRTDQALLEYLRPFWLRWKASKRKDGVSYSPMNLAWLTNWAMNNLMPERPDDNGDWVVSTSPQAFANARIPMPAVAQ